MWKEHEAIGAEKVGAFGFSAGGSTLRRQCQENGLATGAVGALVDVLPSRPDVRHAIGIVDARNAASIQVLERLGMTSVSSQETVVKDKPCTSLAID